MNTHRKPDWLKIRLPKSSNFTKVNKIIKSNGLHTICTSGKCPNMGECWDAGTATLMILGSICTRSCKFCAVATGKPLPLDPNEPKKIALSVQKLNLKHCVLTSVDRDDLEDKGSEHWAKTVLEIKKLNANTTIETLIPDFDGIENYIQKVIDAKPEVISHNLETVRDLSPNIRTRAKYDRSLKVLKYISKSGIATKSGIMLGLGETYNQVIETINDLKNINCSILTIGQYLQPTKQNIEVKEYIHPDIFAKYKKFAINIGFKHVESSPLVRSSYHAEKHV